MGQERGAFHHGQEHFSSKGRIHLRRPTRHSHFSLAARRRTIHAGWTTAGWTTIRPEPSQSGCCTYYAINCFKFVDMPRSGRGATVLPAETHTRRCSSSSYFVRSISTFLRAATFEHIRNHAEARASTYSLSAA